MILGCDVSDFIGCAIGCSTHVLLSLSSLTFALVGTTHRLLLLLLLLFLLLVRFIFTSSRSGARLLDRDENGFTPLHFSAMFGRTAMCR